MKDKIKKINNIIILLFITFFVLIQFSQFVSADLDSLEKWKNDLTNNQKIILQQNIERYDPQVLDEFAKLEGTNETFVDLIIYIKDMSEVENLILTFSKDEIGRVINRNISNRIAIEMNERSKRAAIIMAKLM